MVHPSWYKAGSDVAVAIMEGKHDKELTTIDNACKTRLKVLFRKGAQVKLVNIKNNIAIEGKIGTIIKTNTKSVSVGLGTKDEYGFYSEGEFNVPPNMLEPVS